MSDLESSYVLLDNHHGLKALLSTLGAGVRSLTLNGKRMILELQDSKEYLSAPFLFGKTLCRFGGRVAAEGEIDGVPYHLVDEEGQGYCLHGGLYLSPIFQNYNVTLEETEENVSAVFERVSPDGEAGFPGNLKIKVTYLMPKDLNILTIKYECVTDKPTLLSLSNHMYWNFGDGNVDDYYLSIQADRVATFAPNSLMIAGKANVPTPLDCREEKRVGDLVDYVVESLFRDYTLDQTYLFENPNTIQPQVTLRKDNVIIQCFTDFNAVNVYVENTKKPIVFANGENLTTLPRRGIAIEPQTFVLNHDILRPGEVYQHFISYRFVEK